MPMCIYIQISSTEWRPASRYAKDDEELRKLLGKFAHRISKIYAKEVVKAIESQRYKSRWEPLSPSYIEYKKKNHLSDKIWEATSLVHDSIGVWRSNKRYVVGIKRNVRYPGSNIQAYKIIRMLEFGTSKMPARPLFMPIKRMINKNLREYWEEFLLEEGINTKENDTIEEEDDPFED
jgi:hypothetical protein